MALTVFSQNLFSTSYRSSRHFFATREKNSKVPNMYSLFQKRTSTIYSFDILLSKRKVQNNEKDHHS